MAYIPLRECHICKPEIWELTDIRSSGTYLCTKCGTIIYNILERRPKNVNQENIRKMAQGCSTTTT